MVISACVTASRIQAYRESAACVDIGRLSRPGEPAGAGRRAHEWVRGDRHCRDGVHIAPLDPWLHIDYAVTGIRLNSYRVQVNPGQPLTRQEALRRFTRANMPPPRCPSRRHFFVEQRRRTADVR